ncbi:MAG TPA: tetratricopeptide repeat protein [Myxococcales bacterium]|nr:tetratricopeptide repeat protein [Myxococcales bacterium]
MNYAKCMSPNQQTLTIQQAIDLAMQHHTAGRLSEAESLYQYILQNDPNHPVALHLLGVTAHQAGKNEMAVELISKALAIKPDYTEAHNNHGLALQGLGKMEEAVVSFQQALAIKPNSAETHSNLGLALHGMGQIEKAIVRYHKALVINPDFARAHYNLGQSLMTRGDRKGAISCFEEVLKLEVGDLRAGAEFSLAYLGVLEAPSRTPETYMKEYYKTRTWWWRQLGTGDDQSDDYQGHALMSEALKIALKGRMHLAILDGGCGTGILGRFLRPYASQLDGVDLSPEMLQVAREEGLYDNLVNDELGHYLSQGEQRYQVVVSAAVLIHFSTLNVIFAKIWDALDNEGTLALTLFVDDACEDFAIRPSGFFAHNPDYVRRVGLDSGFTLTHEAHGVHELLDAQEITGAVFVFEK